MLTAGAQAWILGDWYANILPPPLSSIEDVYVSVFVTAYVYLLAYLLYLIHPRSIIKKEGLTEISQSTPSPARDTVNKLANVMGCHAPRFFASENYRRQSAKVFGLGSEKILKVDGGLSLMSVRDPKKFEAIILHELAHIKNHDIFKGYYARCLFWVALAATVPVITFRGISYIIQVIEIYPGILVHLDAGNYKWFALWHLQNIPRLIVNIGPFLFMQLVLTIEYCSILRAREHHADWTASIHGAREALISIFESNGAPTKRTGWSIFKKHPTLSQRAKFILHPEKNAFKITGLDSFLTAYAVYTTFQTILLVMELFSTLIGGQTSERSNWLTDWTSVLTVIPVMLAGTIYAIILWSRMIQKFTVGEWLNKSNWSAIIKHASPIAGYSVLGIFAGDLFWPEQLYKAVTFTALLESFHNTLIFLPALLTSAYFVMIATLYGISRSEGQRKPKSLFIISHIIGFYGFNIGIAYAIYQLRTPDTTKTFESLGTELLPLTIIGIIESLVFIAILFGLLKLFMRRRKRVPLDALAPAWLLITEE